MALKGRARPNQAGAAATALLRSYYSGRRGRAVQTVRVDLYGCDTFHMFCPASSSSAAIYSFVFFHFPSSKIFVWSGQGKINLGQVYIFIQSGQWYSS